MKYTIIIEETVSEELTLEAENKRKRWRRRGGCIGRESGCWSREIWWK